MQNRRDAGKGTVIHPGAKGCVTMEILESITRKGTAIRVIRGDLTESDVDAVVNAANSYLQHGGGVAAAIVRKGGRIIQEESDRAGYVPVGHCAITTGGSLKARYVIHTVGPRWGEGDEEQKLKDAVVNTLALATERGFTSLSMPAVSAGIFGFPKRRCAEIMVGESVNFITDHDTSLKEINFFLMDRDIIQFFTEELRKQEEGN